MGMPSWCPFVEHQGVGALVSIKHLREWCFSRALIGWFGSDLQVLLS